MSWVLSLVKLMASYPKCIHPLPYKGFPGPCVPQLGCHYTRTHLRIRGASSCLFGHLQGLLAKSHEPTFDIILTEFDRKGYFLNLGQFTWHHRSPYSNHTLKFIKIEKLEIGCTTISNGDDEWFYPIAQFKVMHVWICFCRSWWMLKPFTNEDPMLNS